MPFYLVNPDADANPTVATLTRFADPLGKQLVVALVDPNAQLRAVPEERYSQVPSLARTFNAGPLTKAWRYKGNAKRSPGGRNNQGPRQENGRRIAGRRIGACPRSEGLPFVCQ
jgi:hypothetical protein